MAFKFAFSFLFISFLGFTRVMCYYDDDYLRLDSEEEARALSGSPNRASFLREPQDYLQRASLGSNPRAPLDDLQRKSQESLPRARLYNPPRPLLDPVSSSASAEKVLNFTAAEARLAMRMFKVKNRIVGGYATSISRYPYNARYGEGCGAVIIAPEWLLTAGHCSQDYKFIIAGSTIPKRGTKSYIKDYFPHPNYGSGNSHPMDYDYQLLKLKEPLKLSRYIKPIRIARKKDYVVGAYVTVTGWGRTAFNGPRAQGLRVVHVPVVDIDTCKKVENPLYEFLTDNMFCAGYKAGAKDACQGDSGGPAVIHSRLIGLVSFGYECASPNAYGVYSFVPNIRQWIQETTGIHLE